MLSIYAYDRTEPTIIATYRLDGGFTKDMSWWVRDDKATDFEVLNAVNTLAHRIYFIAKNKVKEKHIFRAYQELFAIKKFENLKMEKEEVETIHGMMAKPKRNYVRFTKEYMKKFIDDQIINFTRKANDKLKGVGI
jgi:hypothetical protein